MLLKRLSYYIVKKGIKTVNDLILKNIGDNIFEYICDKNIKLFKKDINIKLVDGEIKINDL